MGTRSSRGNKSAASSQKEDGPTLPAGATLPATEPQVDFGSPTACLPSQDRQCPRNVQIQSGTEEAAAAAGKEINSDSFHRRIHEDYQHQHLPLQQQGNLFPESFLPGAENSIGEEWIPASAQQHSTGGWSYSEGDEVNLPEASLPGDAQFSQIDGETGAETEDRAAAAADQQHLQLLVRQRYGPGYTIIAQRKSKRKPVQERYPAYRQHQTNYSMMESVCQPTPPRDGGGNGGGLISLSPPGTDDAGADKNTRGDKIYNNGGIGGERMSMPTPQQLNFSGNSAAQRNLTPEEKEAIEGRKQAALARRAELERERGNKVARRNLNFGGGWSAGNVHHQQQQVAPALVPPMQIQNAQPLPSSALNPAQAQRAEENRQRALRIRQNKLMVEAVALAHAVLASNPSSSGGDGSGEATNLHLSGWKAKIKHDVRKLITAQRHSAHITSSSASPSPLSTPPPPPAAGAATATSSDSRQITPEQRQRAEENRQKALQRQMEKVEQRVAAFLDDAMQRAQNEKAAATATATRALLPHQQNDDQMFRRFL
jgi:hypothetical protein